LWIALLLLTLLCITAYSKYFSEKPTMYEVKSISKLQIVIEKKRIGIMTYKLHLFFNVISKQI